MKKSLVLTICMIFLAFGANAFALVAYDQTFSGKDINLNNGKGHSVATFTFANITDNFIISKTTPYPTLNLILKGNSDREGSDREDRAERKGSNKVKSYKEDSDEGNKKSKAFSGVLRISDGKKFKNLATITSLNHTYRFDATTMGYLNDAVTNGSLTFSLLRSSGETKFTSAKLTGTVAPEPVSMALVAAGMLGLPFARRLKKTICAKF